jgi:hypothetical protein
MSDIKKFRAVYRRGVFGRAEVEFNDDLARIDRNAYESLLDTLLGMTGVEDVHMRRYSAVIRLASHIIDLDGFLPELHDVLHEELTPLKEMGWDVVIVDGGPLDTGFAEAQADGTTA